MAEQAGKKREFGSVWSYGAGGIAGKESKHTGCLTNHQHSSVSSHKVHIAQTQSERVTAYQVISVGVYPSGSSPNKDSSYFPSI